MMLDEQIISCENRLLDAMRNGEIDTLNELLHDDLIFNIPSGQTITKEMDLENYRSGMLVINHISVTDRLIKIIDNVATVVVTIHLNANYAAQNFEGKFRYLRIWKLFDNSWKIIAGSGSQME